MKKFANYTIVHCCNCNNIMKLYENPSGTKSGQCSVCKTVISTTLHKKKKVN